MLALANKLSITTQPIYRFVNKYSIDFDGVDDYIQVGDVGRAKSMSFWFKPDAAIDSSSSSQRVFGFSTSYFGISTGGATGLFAGETLTVLPDGSSRTATTRNFDAGEWYHVVISWNESASYYDIYVNGVLETDLNTGTHTLADWSNFKIGAAHDSTAEFDGKLDEVAVYDRTLTQAEITRMYNTYYSPNRVANGNFSQIGNEEVTNGDFSQEGSELVTNGDFATDSDWNITGGTDANISGGKANFVNAAKGQRVQQNFSFTANKIYKVVLTVSNYASGRLNFYMGGSYVGSDITADGAYTYYHTPSNNTEAFFRAMQNNTLHTFSIDSITVKEVGQDWTFGDGWGMGDGLATCDGSQSATSYLEQTLTTPLVQNKIYKVTYTATIPNGNLRPELTGGGGTSEGTSQTTSGTYTDYIKAENNHIKFRFRANSSFDGTVDNISIKEVGQHWTFGTGWSMGDGKVIGVNATANLEQSISFTNGGVYKISFTISDYVSGQVRLQTNVQNSIVVSANGTYTESLTMTTDNKLLFNGIDSNPFNGSIDNIVVQELKHDATNLMINHSEYQSANPLITSTKSMEFDGTDDYLQLSEPFNYTNHTICAWVYNDAVETNEIFSASDSVNAGIRLMTRSTGVFRYRLDDANIESGTGSFVANKWYFIAATYDGTNAKIYVNGVLENTVSTTKTFSTTTNARIGSQSYNVGALYDGNITEVGTWDRTLTALEVASLYNQGMPTDLLVSRGDYVATNLVGYWKMGDGTNDEYPVIYDQTNPTLSAELVTNGDFSDGSTGWENAFGSEWVISGGKATLAVGADGSYLRTVSNILTSGKSYKAIITTSGGLDSNNKVTIYATSNTGQKAESDGTHTFYFTADNTSFRFLGTANDRPISIDSVSVKEIQGNPAVMTNMVEGNITNQYPLTKIRNYYRMGDGILDGYPLIADQTNPSLGSELVTNGDFSTDSDWTKNSNWSIANGKATSTGSGRMYQSIPELEGNVGTVVQVTFDIVERTSGGVVINCYGGESNLFNTVGTHSFTTTTTNNLNLYINNSGAGNLVGSIDNVSVKQVNGSPGIMTNMSASDIIEDTPNEPN